LGSFPDAVSTHKSLANVYPKAWETLPRAPESLPRLSYAWLTAPGTLRRALGKLSEASDNYLSREIHISREKMCISALG